MAKHTLKDFLNKYGYLVFVTLLIVLLIVTVLYTKGVSELKDSTTTSSTQKSLLVSPPMETSDVNTEEPTLEQTMPPKLGSSNDNDSNDNDDDDDSDDGDSDDGDSTDDGSPNKNNLYLILFVVGVVLTLLAAMYSFLTTSTEKVPVITPLPEGKKISEFQPGRAISTEFKTNYRQRAIALINNLKEHAKDNKDQYIMNFLLIFYVVMTFGFYHGENIHTKDKDKKNGKRTYVLSMVEIGLLCLYLLIHSIMSYNEFNKITTQDIRATVGQAYTDFITNLKPLRSALMRQKKEESQQGGGNVSGPQTSTDY